MAKDGLSRRSLLAGGISFAIATAATTARAEINPHPFYGGLARDPALFPPPESPIDFPIEQQDLSEIPEEFHRQVVLWDSYEDPGTIVVDPAKRFLYYIQEDATAIRYGVGVGRAGFAWSGEATIGMKRKWPRWLPPEEMVYRDAKAQEWVNGMPGGPENPLGARALYLYADGKDTLFRIHGTNDPKSIGKAMSSGCIRMLNQDVAELFELVPVGAHVFVIDADI